MHNLIKTCLRCYQKTFIILIVTLSFSFIYGFKNSRVYAETSLNDETLIPKEYNIILILLDSVRADHLNCYGYNRDTSPTIDKLASEGLLFEYAISQSTWSLPSHCSIFTSKYVPSHGVDDTNTKLGDSELTLAEILKIYGYKTTAFTGGFWIDSIFNVGQGFDIYHDELIFGKIRDIGSQAIDWLRKNKDNKFFLFLQGFDGHSPFDLPRQYEEMYADPYYNGVFRTLTLDHRIGDRLFGDIFFLDYDFKNKIKITAKDIEYIIAQYDGSIAYADKYIGEFLKNLDKLNLRNNTIIILTSYHGSSLFEHGIILRRQHGGVTEGTIHIPLIIRHPGLNRKGRRIGSQVQQIDIMPTVLDFVGIPINHQAQGRSLIPLIEGKATSDFNEYTYVNGYKEMAIRTRTWKLIEFCEEGKGPELYNIQKDKREKNNLIRKKRKVANTLKQKLDEWFKYVKTDSKQLNLIPEPEIAKIKEGMKKAGYWFLDIPPDKEIVGRQAPKGLH